MSKQAVLNLIEESKSDESLLAQLESAEGPQTILEIAKSKGYEFTEDELLSVMQEQQLSFADEQEPVELNNVALNFIKEVGNNQAWKEDLESINTPADIVRYAADKGYEFSEDEVITIIEHQQELASQEGELTEDALEAVAGGAARISGGCTRTTTRDGSRSSTTTSCSGSASSGGW